jgi:ACS family glucarate transporter-like MFS transporter
MVAQSFCAPPGVLVDADTLYSSGGKMSPHPPLVQAPIEAEVAHEAFARPGEPDGRFRSETVAVPGLSRADTAPMSRVRYAILVMLFLVTAINVGDRTALSITGAAITTQLHISAVELGYMFSVFAWAYVLGQLPGGLLLDRFGSVKIYGLSLLLWSLITIGQGMAGYLSATMAVATLFTLRFLLGIIESPVYPANSRLVAAWFPTQERGLATVIFNSSMYLSVALFSPLMGFVAHALGWKAVYWTMGGLGVLTSVAWFKFVKTPQAHPSVNEAELRHIEEGGAISEIDSRVRGDQQANQQADARKPTLNDLRVLLRSRMMWSIYLGKYCDTSLQYFFITWFPVYLVKYRGLNIMEAGALTAVPAICGLLGALCGGAVCDFLLRRGFSLTIARKVPLVCGMAMGGTLLLCNFTTSMTLVTVLMSIAIFGKGIVAVDWTLVTDTAPQEIAGMAGGLFNMFGNISGIVTPVLIGYVVLLTGSFEGAMYLVAAHAFIGALAFLAMGRIHRLQLAA